MNARDVVWAIAALGGLCGVDPERGALWGVRVRVDEQGVTVVATDGNVLGLVASPTAPPELEPGEYFAPAHLAEAVSGCLDNMRGGDEIDPHRTFVAWTVALRFWLTPNAALDLLPWANLMRVVAPWWAKGAMPIFNPELLELVSSAATKLGCKSVLMRPTGLESPLRIEAHPEILEDTGAVAVFIVMPQMWSPALRSWLSHPNPPPPSPPARVLSLVRTPVAP